MGKEQIKDCLDRISNAPTCIDCQGEGLMWVSWDEGPKKSFCHCAKGDLFRVIAERIGKGKS